MESYCELEIESIVPNGASNRNVVIRTKNFHHWLYRKFLTFDAASDENFVIMTTFLLHIGFSVSVHTLTLVLLWISSPNFSDTLLMAYWFSFTKGFQNGCLAALLHFSVSGFLTLVLLWISTQNLGICISGKVTWMLFNCNTLIGHCYPLPLGGVSEIWSIDLQFLGWFEYISLFHLNSITQN